MTKAMTAKAKEDVMTALVPAEVGALVTLAVGARVSAGTGA